MLPICYLFFDTEFTDFESLTPISIGIVSEDKQHEFYKEINDKPEWKDISSALGKDRKLWYKNIMIFIQSKVDKSLSIQSFNPFELNQS